MCATRYTGMQIWRRNLQLNILICPDLFLPSDIILSYLQKLPLFLKSVDKQELKNNIWNVFFLHLLYRGLYFRKLLKDMN